MLGYAEAGDLNGIPLFLFHGLNSSRLEVNINIMFSLDDVDKDLIKDKHSKEALLETFRESYRQGTQGVAYDAKIVFTKPWGFTLGKIDFTSIHLWHG